MRGLAAALPVALIVTVAAAPASVADDVDELLGRAVAMGREVPHTGRIVVAAFSEDGPRIAELTLTRDADGLRLVRERQGLPAVGTSGRPATAAEELLEVTGLGHDPDQLRRLRAKYRLRRDAPVELDTGPATPLELHERGRAVRREVLYLDAATGLVVRRETYRPDGGPLRVVAYTSLSLLDDGEVAGRPEAGWEVAGRSSGEMAGRPGAGWEVAGRSSGEVAGRPGAGPGVTGGSSGEVAARGEGPGSEPSPRRPAGAPARLPAGYELVDSSVVEHAAGPTVHLLYGDGLYWLSVFRQEGRMAPAARHGATRLTVDGGGVVWRWPGSEPRRLVWSGGGDTYTALSDAPTDEVLRAIAGLPVDRPEGSLARLYRGVGRLVDWLVPGGDTRTDRSAG